MREGVAVCVFADLVDFVAAAAAAFAGDVCAYLGRSVHIHSTQAGGNNGKLITAARPNFPAIATATTSAAFSVYAREPAHVGNETVRFPVVLALEDGNAKAFAFIETARSHSQAGVSQYPRQLLHNLRTISHSIVFDCARVVSRDIGKY